MLKYTIIRLLMMIPAFFGITLISFLVIHLAPGDPTAILTEHNPRANPNLRQRLNEIYGLDKPLHVQYLNWVGGLIQLDFKKSMSQDPRPVSEKIKERLPVTLAMNLVSLAIILLLSFPIGLISAVRAGGAFDKISTMFVFIFFAAPSFWMALLAMDLFGIKLQALPISGLTSYDYQSLSRLGKIVDLSKHLALPILISSLSGLAGISRYLRSNMLDIIRQDYITTARAKGLSERMVIWKHALRNALIPVITILGLSVPGLVAGSVIIESIFAIPGLGLLMFEAVRQYDYTMVMGGLVMSAVLTLIGNLLADLGYALADPRIRDTAFK
ncbi:MAG: ABC transporter permease [Deltaproteobacteria bacterium]|jgi:peptide/nickel transport system permease protein|nr:ABC transporter permease [Deltaproteobacteria bacterium]